MDNREFAKVLLCEATELLNEGARYRKEIKDYEGYSSHSIGKKASKLYAKKDNLGAIIWNTAGKMMSANTKDDINPNSASKSLNNMAKYMTGEITDSEKKEYEKREKSKELHDKINNRAKKTQNESIAILLTEAALLLNEGARWKKDIPLVATEDGDTPYYYGKEAAKNFAKAKQHEKRMAELKSEGKDKSLGYLGNKIAKGYNNASGKFNKYMGKNAKELVNDVLNGDREPVVK